MKVVFVCTGNTCRSAMAEVIFRDLAGDVEVVSAGTHAVSGLNAEPNAVEVCRRHGLDLTGHLSKNIADLKIEDDDLILTATALQIEFLLKAYPGLEICTIREYAGCESPDIEDPIGGDVEVYENCFCQIRNALEKIVEMDGF